MRLSRTRLWLLARINPALAGKFRDLAAEARSNHEAWKAARAEAAAHAASNRSLRQQADILREQLQHAETQLAACQTSLAAAEAELGELREGDRQRAERLESLAAELRDERHEHAKTAKQLELAGEENRLLAAIHETDIARRKREQALLDRDRAEAETALLVARRQVEEE
ncbi:MAG TPA: hypothetical protein VMV10_10130 [Pirellulales bacterium]|nr:hypothetical protein [Pirellulales bacterium]